MKSSVCSCVVSLVASCFVGSTVLVDAYVSSSSTFVGRRGSIVPRATAGTSRSSSSLSSMYMDLEQAEVTYSTARFNLDQLLVEQSRPLQTIDEVQAQHGMPWKSSIDPNYNKDEELLYMRFWEWQTEFLKDNLTNLKVLSCSNGKTDFGYNENTSKKARIVSICLSSSEYRKIRLTYYDAGDNTQVFNAVFYPDAKYNLPVLGIDVLAFNRKKYLAIVDFQPLHDREEDHAATYEHLLKPIKEQYDNLKGRMSSKFYDETKFFSQQMLFSRFEDESIIHRELFPAFTQYVQTHLQLIRDTVPDYANSDLVLQQQRAYDTYSAERDPAIGLFTAMFGADWAEDFVHDFLFSLSERPSSSTASPSKDDVASVPPRTGASSPITTASTSSMAHSPAPSQLAFVQQPRR